MYVSSWESQSGLLMNIGSLDALPLDNLSSTSLVSGSKGICLVHLFLYTRRLFSSRSVIQSSLITVNWLSPLEKVCFDGLHGIIRESAQNLCPVL